MFYIRTIRLGSAVRRFANSASLSTIEEFSWESAGTCGNQKSLLPGGTSGPLQRGGPEPPGSSRQLPTPGERGLQETLVMKQKAREQEKEEMFNNFVTKPGIQKCKNHLQSSTKCYMKETDLLKV